MVACAIGAMIIWPILDLLYDAIFTHSGFVYSIEEHMTKPMIFGCIAGVVFWMVVGVIDINDETYRLLVHSLTSASVASWEKR